MSDKGQWDADDRNLIEQVYRSYFEKLDDATWQTLSYEERKEVLQEVEEYEAKKAHRPSASFQAKDGMPLASRGYYSPFSNSITQNYQYTMANSSVQKHPLKMYYTRGDMHINVIVLITLKIILKWIQNK